jgi:hypothetical protein
MKKLLFIADFFSDQLTGGAELNDNILLTHLSGKYEVVRRRCAELTREDIDAADLRSPVAFGFYYLRARSQVRKNTRSESISAF